MKKLLIGLLLIITTQSFGQVVWPKVPPTFQQFGSSTTWSQFNGTVYPVVGFITPTYDDTTVANGNGYAKFMPFNIISTSDGGFWRRNFAATKWEEISIGGNSWDILGNAGLNDSTNFLGTTDATNLRIKVGGRNAGIIKYTATPSAQGGDVALGQYALEYLTANSGHSTTAYSNNVAVGNEALRSLQTGGETVAIGNWAARTQTTGDPTESDQARNVAVGQSALYMNYQGGHNTAVGTFSLEGTNSGKYNSGFGSNSLRSNKMGIGNSALGYFSLLRGTTSVASVNVTSGGSGYTTATVTISAPEAGTPGVISSTATATATINAGAITAITVTDRGAGYTNIYGTVTATITGDGVGATATVTLISSEYNSAFGNASLAFNRIGRYNTAIGHYAGYGAGGNEYTLLDDNSVFVGALASRHSAIPNETKLTNANAFGYNAKVGCSNCLVLGDSALSTKVGIGTSTPRKKLDVVLDDAQIYELTVGRGSGGVITNTAFGYETLLSTTSGSSYNTAIGWNANKSGTGVALTTAIGANALNLGGGDFETAIGANSLRIATSGSTRNTGVGYGSLFSLTTGTNNVAGGYGAGFSIVSGDYNVGVGVGSLGSGYGGGGVAAVLTGDDNIGIGRNSLLRVTSGSGNVGIGYLAGDSITTGSFNVVLGGFRGSFIAAKSRHLFLADGEGNVKIMADSVGNVGIGTSSPSASALLDVSSTTKGALMPRMTTTQRDAISSPATGLELFNTTTNSKQIYDGTRWVEAAHPLYKVYTALLTQSGTSAPTATVMENNLGGTVVWTYVGDSDYRGTLSGAFTQTKTAIFWQTGYDAVAKFDCYRLNDNAIEIQNPDTGLDGTLNYRTIEIRVYY